MTHTLTFAGILVLASCSSSNTPVAATAEAGIPASTKATAPPKNMGADTMKGVNKTVNGVNRVGNTVRSVQLISGLFR